MPEKTWGGGLRRLAEAVIMQAMEDLWDREYRIQSLDFFSGERFEYCAELAGMPLYEQLALLKILRDSLKISPPAYSGKAVFRSAADSAG
jgi:hypothetical protein